MQRITDPFTRVLDRLDGVRRSSGSGDRAYARCPAHDDRHGSLTVVRGRSVVLLRCFAGCRLPDICRAIGLTVADLRFGPRPDPVEAQLVAAYVYETCEGVAVRKQRWHPKAFRWQRRESTAWVSGLRGLHPRLYRLADLVDESVVVVTEGEKAVDALWSSQVAATCPPYASTWRDTWTFDLWRAGCRVAVVVADADQAGWAQGRRIAARLWHGRPPEIADDADPASAPLLVKLVRLDAAVPRGGDPYDFLESHGSTSLRALIEATPLWTPDFERQQRDDRRRQLGRARVAHHRARKRAATLEVA